MEVFIIKYYWNATIHMHLYTACDHKAAEWLWQRPQGSQWLYRRSQPQLQLLAIVPSFGGRDCIGDQTENLKHTRYVVMHTRYVVMHMRYVVMQLHVWSCTLHMCSITEFYPLTSSSFRDRVLTGLLRLAFHSLYKPE